MSNLDNIIEEILKNAKDEAKVIIDNANEKKELEQKKAQEEAKLNADRLLEKEKIESIALKDRMVSNANLIARDKILVAKQEMIDKIFDMAKEKLKNLDHERYLKFVENTLKTLDVSENSEILLTKAEKEKAPEMLFNVKVSENCVESGFSLKCGKIIYNNEFSSIVDMLKEDLEQEIIKELFS